MGVRKNIDRLASADPRLGGRRWALPMWLLSTLMHAGLILLLAATWVTTSKSLPAEETMDVGIVLKSETPTSVVFESDNEIFEEPLLSDPLQSTELDALDETFREPTTATKDVVPDLEMLATAGQSVEQAQKFLPPAAMPVGGGRSRTRFFNAEDVGKSFIWIVDRSASMSHRDALGLAKREIVTNLDILAPETRFQVIFYNTAFNMIPSPGNKLLPASTGNLSRAKSFLKEVAATGGTEHNPALLAAFKLQPEVIYFLTDADMMTDRDVEMLTKVNRKSRPPATIHTIEFGNGPRLSSNKPLRRLSALNDGTYSYINVEKFTKRTK